MYVPPLCGAVCPALLHYACCRGAACCFFLLLILSKLNICLGLLSHIHALYSGPQEKYARAKATGKAMPFAKKDQVVVRILIFCCPVVFFPLLVVLAVSNAALRSYSIWLLFPSAMVAVPVNVWADRRHLLSHFYAACLRDCICFKKCCC